MPEVVRQSIRMDCEGGIDLVTPVDRMKPGSFPYLFNARVVQEGRIDGRPGYTPYGSGVGGPRLLNSIRRLNDPDESVAPSGHIYVVGNGTQLWTGQEAVLNVTDTGYSGNPLSLIPFRPDVSPESWMYVYDANKQSKVSAAGTLRPVGATPPNAAPQIEYGVPGNSAVSDGNITPTGFTVTGVTTGISLQDRTGGAALTIAAILYAPGTTSGWCCINPSSGDTTWAGERMRIVLNSGAGVEVREIHAAINATTISGIRYDAGTTGACSIVFAAYQPILARNSLIVLSTTETVRVLDVVPSPDGVTYSVRASTTLNHAIGDTVTGLLSWFVFTPTTHSTGESILCGYYLITQPGAGVGSAQNIASVNAGITSNGRPVSMANDYLHVSLFLENPLAVTTVTLMLDIDPATPTTNTPFVNNFIQWAIPIAQIGSFGSGSTGVWVEVVVPLSQGVQIGNDPTLNMTTVHAISVGITSTGACNYGYDWWYNFGTFGPVIQPNAPTGYQYLTVYRDSTTGTTSVPGPTGRHQVNPLREQISVIPAATNQSGIDSIDIYRFGGTLDEFTYIGTVANSFFSPIAFNDTLSDESIANNPQADLTLLQPWPVLGIGWSGLVSVVGTSVTWISGTQFNVNLVANSIILIGGNAFLTRGQPHSATYLEIQSNAGVFVSVAYAVASPTLAAQSLGVAFGPLEGPFAPVVFAVGDPINAGTLYYSNTSNLDAASDQNTLEICGPSEPLITGEVWNGIVMVGSRENVYLVRFSFVQSVVSTAAPYQFSRMATPSGFWSRWAICRGPDGIYALGRDGIYRWTEQGGVNISDARLYPLFPHDGQPASVTNGLYPVDMTQTSYMRLSCLDNEISFVYMDTQGNPVVFRYDIPKNRWFPHSFFNYMSYEYLDEPLVDSPDNMQILQLSKTLGAIYQIGGNTDNGAPINSLLQTVSTDGGDERLQKLPTDYIVDSDQAGIISAAQFYNNNVVNTAAQNVTSGTGRSQSIVNISSVPGTLNLWKNISVKLAWSGGPGGPRIYAIEPAWYVMPFLSTRVVTQFIELGFPGWKHFRRLFSGLISTSSITLLIQCQNGRTFNVTIPSTGGQFLIQPQMIPQTCKDLSFAFELDSAGIPFALFPESFTLETKEWDEDSFIKLAVFKT